MKLSTQPRNTIKQPQEVKIAIAQITTDPGAIEQNTEKIINAIREARANGAKIITFPELTIPAYSAMDLLYDREYLKECRRALKKICKESNGISVIVGTVDWDPKRKLPGNRPYIWNSAVLIENGTIKGVQDKSLLPTYNIFDENRYFAPPRETKVVSLSGVKVGTEICEDLWSDDYAVNPTKNLVNKGAELIVNLSASPFHIGKLATRLNLLSTTAKKSKTPIVYTNLVGCFDGFEGEVVFDGRSLVIDKKGQPLAVGPAFKEGIFYVDPFKAAPLKIPEVDKTAELHDALVLGIRDYYRRIGGEGKANFKKAIVGLSGGIDSAVVVALAVEALGKDAVLGVTIPTKYTSRKTLKDAIASAKNLDIELKKVPIKELHKVALEGLKTDPSFKNLADGIPEENIQARLRMLVLMYYGNKVQGIVLNTGNKTELALDNCTIYGDMVGGFSVLGDVDKDRVYDLAFYINEKAGREVIPLTTIERVPTAELKPNQTDAMVMGGEPREIAPLVRTIVEEGLSLSAARKKFTGVWPDALIQRVFSRLDRSEWKRRQASPAIRVTPVAFGIGRRFPMSHGFWKLRTPARST
jgi:NAD+ synthase (glutamine-hydrolysing)